MTQGGLLVSGFLLLTLLPSRHLDPSLRRPSFHLSTNALHLHLHL
jgi:hypothetical protein